MELTPGRVFVATRSGESVTVSSGLNIILNSGASVTIDSGLGVIVASGLNVTVQSGIHVIADVEISVSSGLEVVIQSGAPVHIDSGLSVVVQSGIAVILESGISVSIDSGLNVVVQSGTFVVIQSGATVHVDSGLGVVVASGLNVTTTLASGIAVTMSGVNVVNNVPQFLRARPTILITDVSGGQTLVSAGTVAVSMRSLDGDMYVGGSQGIDFPFSGYGMLLTQGDAMAVEIANPNLISVMAIISGYRMTYIGQQ